MDYSTEVFVGIDLAKSRNAIAISDGERGGEVRFFGEVDAPPESMCRVVQRIAEKHGRAHFYCRPALLIVDEIGYLSVVRDCQEFRVRAGG